MANYRYNRYQYETSPRKLEPEYEPIKEPYSRKKSTSIKNKKEAKKPKKQLRVHIKVLFYVLIIFASLFVISYRNSLINESFNENEKIKSDLALLEKQNEQLKVNLENSLNLANIERIAEKKLGMQKLDNSQKIYVNLDKKDYVEPASEKVVIQEEENWFMEIINKIFGK